MFKLPELQYDTDSLAPWLSEESFAFHYGKHHKSYIDKLNKSIDGTAMHQQSLEQIVRDASGGLLNNAAQAWNHTFFWRSIIPDSNECPENLRRSIEKYFGSISDFKSGFKKAAASQFGSGWAWLVKDASGELRIETTANAEQPKHAVPLLTCDVWEHAYYIDHRNDRKAYIDGFLDNINWAFAQDNFELESVPDMSAEMR